MQTATQSIEGIEVVKVIKRRAERIAGETSDPAKLAALARLIVSVGEDQSSQVPSHILDHVLTCLDRFTGPHLAILLFLYHPQSWIGWNSKKWFDENRPGMSLTFEDMRQATLGRFLTFLMPSIDEPEGMLRTILADLESAGLTNTASLTDGAETQAVTDKQRLFEPWTTPLGESVCVLIFPPPAAEPGPVKSEPMPVDENTPWYRRPPAVPTETREEIGRRLNADRPAPVMAGFTPAHNVSE